MLKSGEMKNPLCFCPRKVVVTPLFKMLMTLLFTTHWGKVIIYQREYHSAVCQSRVLRTASRLKPLTDRHPNDLGN